MLQNPCEGLISLPTFSANSQSDLDRSKLDMQQKSIERKWCIKGWIRESICSHRHLERCHHVALQIRLIFIVVFFHRFNKKNIYNLKTVGCKQPTRPAPLQIQYCNFKRPILTLQI